MCVCEKVEYLLSEWVRHFHQPGLLREGDKVYAAYVARVSLSPPVAVQQSFYDQLYNILSTHSLLCIYLLYPMPLVCLTNIFLCYNAS